MTHQNSREAYRDTCELREARQVAIYTHCLEVRFPQTDREIMRSLGFDEPNQVRPRITKLIETGWLYEAEKVVCEVTLHKVRATLARTFAERAAWVRRNLEMKEAV